VRLTLVTTCCCLHQSEYIHFVEGFLLAPGYIDLSQLRFFTVAGDGNNDDFEEPGGDDDIYVAEQDDDKEGDGGNRRNLDQADDTKGDYKMEGSAVDIAVFHLVSQ
jgi:hypothetical protein